MKFTARHSVWFAAVVTLTLVVRTALRDESLEAPEKKMMASRGNWRIGNFISKKNVVFSAVAASPTLDRDPLIDAGHDPFRGINFSFPPPKVVEMIRPVVPPVVKPTAPPCPYSYFGRMVGIDGRQAIYLSRGEKLFSIWPAEVLDDVYRVDSVDDSRIVLTYLPLNEKVELAVRSSER